MNTNIIQQQTREETAEESKSNKNESQTKTDGCAVSHYDYYWDSMNKKDEILQIVYLHACKDLFPMQSDRYHRELLENQCNYKLKSMRSRFVFLYVCTRL